MLNSGQVYKRFESQYNRKNPSTVEEDQPIMSKALMGKNPTPVEQTDESSSYADLAFKAIRSARNNLKEQF
jgi:hypothetical protein